MSGQNGGKRPGSGRKKGVPNKCTKALLERAMQAGQMPPLEFLLKVMRSSAPEQLEGESIKTYLMRHRTWAELSFEAAKAAAPYCHARLATVENTGNDGGPVQHQLTVKFVE